jgi:hypothetical protein
MKEEEEVESSDEEEIYVGGRHMKTYQGRGTLM